MGNVGAANDLCVNFVVPLREQTWLWGSAKKKKKMMGVVKEKKNESLMSGYLDWKNSTVPTVFGNSLRKNRW